MSDGQFTIRITRSFAAAPEAVFDAFVDPAMASRFLFATPDGEIVRADIDAREGGLFVITDRRDGEDVEHHGTFTEVNRPGRLVFTFSVPKYSPDADMVTFDIVGREAGCDIALTQVMDEKNRAWEASTREGWTMILDALARVVE